MSLVKAPALGAVYLFADVKVVHWWTRNSRFLECVALSLPLQRITLAAAEVGLVGRLLKRPTQ